MKTVSVSFDVERIDAIATPPESGFVTFRIKSKFCHEEIRVTCPADATDEQVRSRCLTDLFEVFIQHTTDCEKSTIAVAELKKADAEGNLLNWAKTVSEGTRDKAVNALVTLLESK